MIVGRTDADADVAPEAATAPATTTAAPSSGIMAFASFLI
jgi:hypothetical protein